MVVECSDEVKPEPETPSPVAIGFFKNAKDFELTNDVQSSWMNDAQLKCALELRCGYALFVPG